jgi:choice-of-anchor A domain-containing protein/uncharacterized repeat protein (TIGR01451 family)
MHASASRAVRPVAFLAALAALLGFASTASATGSVTCVTNPFGAASGYTEFIAGNGHRGSESEGAIAWGGNLDANGMTVGTRLISGSSVPTLVVAGTGTTPSFNLQKGSAFLPSGSNINFNGGGRRLATDPIDFSAAFTDLRAKSTSWATATANGTAALGVAGGNTVLVLTGTDPQLNVFNLTPSQLTSGIGYNVPAGSTVLVNVSGTSAILSGQMWVKERGSWNQVNDNVMEDWPGILWNFPSATSITMGFGSAWGGSILAPNANLSVTSVGHTIGQIITGQFSSNYETHQRLFTGCLPGGGSGGGGGGGGGGTTPPATNNADVQITKTTSNATPQGNQAFSYTLTAKNNGADTAKDVVVRDTLPVGVTFVSASTGCAKAASIVTCTVGDLANGASKAFTINVVADPLAAAGTVPDPGAQHGITISKVEQQVDLNAGETKTVSISCPAAGAILSDGSLRVDAVDQGTGALTDVRVLSTRSTGIASWEAVVRNDATGRAQAKAFAVCLPSSTGADHGHQHSLKVSDPVTSTTQALAAGRQTATVSCATGTRPIVPGYAFTGGAATLAGSEPVSGGWKFIVDVTQATSATLSVRCLSDAVDTASSHTHALVTNHVVRTVTVPAGQTVTQQVICADDAKGIVATWNLPAGVSSLGNDPQPKTRVFRLVNTTGSDQQATIDLECLNDRTGPEVVPGVSASVIDNTATIATSSTDAVSANDSSTARITVSTNMVVPAASGSGVVGSGMVALRTSCTGTCSGTAVVSSGETVLAKGVFRISGGSKTVKLRLTKAGRRALRSGAKHKATVTLKSRHGKKTAISGRTVTLRRA